jgi:uncharacterized protein
MSEKPAPVPNSDSTHYWDACNEERLSYQYCTSCSRPQFFPRAVCVHCGAANPTWRTSSGTGAIYAITYVYVAGHASFRAEVPYAVALIEMDEGFRIMMNVVGSSDMAAIGDRGTVVYEVRGAIKIPQFRPEPRKARDT